MASVGGSWGSVDAFFAGSLLPSTDPPKIKAARPSRISKLGGIAANAAKTVQLNEHRDSGSVALGGKPKFEFVHLAIAAPTPNSGFAVRGRHAVGLERLSEAPKLNSHREAVFRRRITPSGEFLPRPRLLCR